MPKKVTSNTVSNAQWMMGGGNPSVHEMASLFAESDRLMAKMDRTAAEADRLMAGGKPKIASNSWLRSFADSLMQGIRRGLYTFFFLLIRGVLLAVAYGIAISIVMFTLSYILFH